MWGEIWGDPLGDLGRWRTWLGLNEIVTSREPIGGRVPEVGATPKWGGAARFHVYGMS